MSVRPSRRAAAFDFAALTVIERLLIAQAVHELGAASSTWGTLSKLMSRHALVSRPKNFYSPSMCSSIYEYLMRDAALERTEAANAPKAPENLSLAQKHFQIRFDELMALIQAEETKFKTVMKEIEEIKSGKWDRGVPAPDTQPAVDHGEAVTDANTPSIKEVSRRDRDGTEEQLKQEEEEEEGDRENSEEQEEEEEEDAGGEREREEGRKSDVEDHDVAMEDVEGLLETDSGAAEEAGQGGLAYSNEQSRSSEPPTSSKDVEQNDEQGESSADEPLQSIRRSSRRKSSAASNAPPAQPSRAGARTRRQRQLQEQESAGSDAETDGAPKRETPLLDEDSPSSPPASVRTREGKRKASFPDEMAREPKRIREDSELPEDDDTSQISHTTRRPNRHGARAAADQIPNKKFQNVIGLLHQQISAHRNGTIFHNPIKLSDAPDYNEIVKRPMDLKTIKARVKDGAISNSLEFQRDVYLMFANAMMYNRPRSDVYTMAEDMMLESEMQVINFKQTEGFRAQR